MLRYNKPLAQFGLPISAGHPELSQAQAQPISPMVLNLVARLKEVGAQLARKSVRSHAQLAFLSELPSVASSSWAAASSSSAESSETFSSTGELKNPRSLIAKPVELLAQLGPNAGDMVSATGFTSEESSALQQRLGSAAAAAAMTALPVTTNLHGPSLLEAAAAVGDGGSSAASDHVDPDGEAAESEGETEDDTDGPTANDHSEEELNEDESPLDTDQPEERDEFISKCNDDCSNIFTSSPHDNLNNNNNAEQNGFTDQMMSTTNHADILDSRVTHQHHNQHRQNNQVPQVNVAHNNIKDYPPSPSQMNEIVPNDDLSQQSNELIQVPDNTNEASTTTTSISFNSTTSILLTIMHIGILFTVILAIAMASRYSINNLKKKANNSESHRHQPMQIVIV